MLKVLRASQIKEVDAYTIQNEPVSSIDLMERACRAFVSWFTPRFAGTIKAGVVCGTGNNGGDGLGIARLLYDWGYHVKVWIVKGAASESPDFKTNLSRLPEKVERFDLTSDIPADVFSNRDVLIDAIFGTGLSRNAEGVYADVITLFNEAESVRIAIDIPSGMRTDELSGDPIVKADYTVTFQIPKLAFFLPQNHQYTGEWCIADIGLSKQAISDSQTQHFYLQKKDIRKLIRPRSRFDHKGTFGHALLVAGGYGKMGACVLSGRAALRSGVGLLTIHAPAVGYQIVQTALPEAMMTAKAGERHFSEAPEDATRYDAIGIGPGLGQSPETVKALETLLRQYRKPVVIDADALNILSSQSELLHLIPQNSILTPHPKEFERLAGTWKNDFERLEKLKNFAAKLNCYVILKGAFTTIATPKRVVYFNPTGNPGMATGGTGDVLTGILTGLLAQNYSSESCCLLGVYVHGLAGDLGATEMGTTSMIASDLVDFLPAAFKKLNRE
jgi:ADP-dependent NAD(P)H-hydrate dehydratase / NAD(P)H-hydrate epimerase